MISDSKNRRLWIVNQYAITPDMPGGRRHYELASMLLGMGWECTIWATPQNYVSTGSSMRPVSPIKPTYSEDVGGVHFNWLYSHSYTRNDWRRYVNMVSFAAMLLGVGGIQRRPDLIVGSSPHLLAALGAWVLAKRYRVPFVLEIRDLWPETLVQLGLSNKPVVKMLESIERFLYSNADVIVPLTEGIESSIRQKGFDQANIVMIPNASLRPEPIDSDRRIAMRRSLGWENKTVAIWIGAHGPANGLDVIVEAARLQEQRDDLLFVLIGGGSDKLRLKSLAKSLKNVQFMDPVPKDDVDSHLRAADIGLLVHRDTVAVKGARPNKLFDYLAASLPIVNNMDGEPRRLVEEAAAGVYVPAEQPKALATAVLELYDSLDLRAQLGRSGFQHVSKEHSRESTALTLDITLKGLLETWEKTHAN